MHNLRLNIEFDPNKEVENFHKHGIRFVDAEQALRDPFALTMEDRDAERERRYATLGMDNLGRLLVVIHTHRGVRVRLISARKATRKEAEAYHHAR